MSKKISIAIVAIIIVIGLAISIYIPNREKLKIEKEDNTIKYSTIQKEGKMGVAEGENIIIEPLYEQIIIPNAHRAVFMCKNGEDEKFLNDKNEQLFDKYENVQLIEYENSKYEKNILRYEKEGKFGLLSITGNSITEAKYEELENFANKEGEVLVSENGQYGIIDEKGNTKIKEQYISIESDGYYTEENKYKKSGYIVCTVTNEGYRYGYFDSDGIQVLNEEYNQITRLTQIKNETYLIVAKNGQYGVYINNSKIINTQYQSIDYYSDNQIFIVERTGRFGAINIKGTEILPTEYSELAINGIYLYGIKNEEQIVYDINGNVIDIPFNTYISNTSSKKYYIKNEDGNYSILNSNLDVITNQNYKFLEYAYEEYFIATNEQNKVGVINIEEQIVVDFNYDLIQLIKGKSIFQARDFSNSKIDIYDNQFDLALEMSDAQIEILSENVRIYNNKQEIFLDNNGKIIKK